MTNTEYPVARRMMAVNLFIYSITLVVTAWPIYSKNFAAEKISGIVGLSTLLLYLVGGGILYLTRPFSGKLNSDQVIIFYSVLLFTSITIIKWALFWYWNINPMLLPVKYEKWNLIHEMVSFAVAVAGAYLPVIIKQKQTQQKP